MDMLVPAVSELGETGVWSKRLRYAEPEEIAAAAGELEACGYGTLWIPDFGGLVFEALDRLLVATSTVVVATGILNIWRHTPDEVVAWWDSLPEAHRGRVLVGLGVSHGPLIGEKWGRPVAVMNEFLDALDAGGFPSRHLAVAALAPKMLALAAHRSRGAHPYLVTPEHTTWARETVGDAGLYVEQGVIYETDPDAARAMARAELETYYKLPNYVRCWKRLGFSDEEIASRSDRLVDGLFAWGDAEAIEARLEAHRRAGADHVCIQVIDGEGSPAYLEVLRRLAPGASTTAKEER